VVVFCLNTRSLDLPVSEEVKITETLSKDSRCVDGNWNQVSVTTCSFRRESELLFV
jgi:hypothetical protein